MLVNDSLTPEINIQKGLKQRDPLTPFLFLLMDEGLNGLIQWVYDLNHFSGFKVGPSKLKISHLYYTDDTLILVKPLFKTLLVIKAILMGFELALSIRVYFHKSSLIWINVKTFFP